jgi:hypothetical protein
MDAASAIATTASFLVSVPAAAAGVRAYRTFGGLREVSCPETMEAVLVRIHVTQTIASRLSGCNELRLKSCSRWPGRQGCDQACVSQIAASRRVPRSRPADEVSGRTAGSFGLGRPAALKGAGRGSL